MNKRNVDVRVRSLGDGGAERGMTILASGLAPRGHKIRAVTVYEGSRDRSEARGKGTEIGNLQS